MQRSLEQMQSSGGTHGKYDPNPEQPGTYNIYTYIILYYYCYYYNTLLLNQMTPKGGGFSLLFFLFLFLSMTLDKGPWICVPRNSCRPAEDVANLLSTTVQCD